MSAEGLPLLGRPSAASVPWQEVKRLAGADAGACAPSGGESTGNRTRVSTVRNYPTGFYQCDTPINRACSTWKTAESEPDASFICWSGRVRRSVLLTVFTGWGLARSEKEKQKSPTPDVWRTAADDLP